MKKVKLDNQNIPQLNEDIFGIILKYAVRMEQEHVFEGFAMLDEYSQGAFLVQIEKSYSEILSSVKNFHFDQLKICYMRVSYIFKSGHQNRFQPKLSENHPKYSEWQVDHSDPCSRPSVHEIQWPGYLDSNSRRLIHHTNVKLFSKCTLTFPNKLRKEFNTKHDLDVLWKTLKHFGQMRFWDGPVMGPYGLDSIQGPGETPAMCLQKMWREIQTPSKLVKALEERMT